jgi:hypothetical protein
MSKKIAKKLVLAKNTMRNLADGSLKRVGGGESELNPNWSNCVCSAEYCPGHGSKPVLQ